MAKWTWSGAALVALGMTVAPAWGQEATESFASAFFWATRDDGWGNKSIEWLGSLVIWFLILLSMLSITLIIGMVLSNKRKSIVPPGMVEQARRLMSEGKYRIVLDMTTREKSFFSEVLNAALREANHGYTAMIRQLEQTADELTTIRFRRIEYLNVLGQVSPMIGLFGTVYGMILAFQAIVVSGGNANPVLLAGGIGTALTTTFWGLVVAIPALAGYAIIRNRIDEYTTEAIQQAEQILNQFRPRGLSKKGERSASASVSEGDAGSTGSGMSAAQSVAVRRKLPGGGGTE